MAFDQPKKMALTTGCNRGLGKDMALSLARLGMDVVLAFNSNQAPGEAVADEIRRLGGRAAALRLDFSDIASIGAFLALDAEDLNSDGVRPRE
jgi:NAD(P)-dependent dehydrogenase (short-subunit alcohol dehydrogenase family)